MTDNGERRLERRSASFKFRITPHLGPDAGSSDVVVATHKALEIARGHLLLLSRELAQKRQEA